MHSGVVSYTQFLSLTQVITLLPDRLYPGIQSSSTLVLWSTGSGVSVFILQISGSSPHLSERKGVMRKNTHFIIPLFLQF